MGLYDDEISILFFVAADKSLTRPLLLLLVTFGSCEIPFSASHTHVCVRACASRGKCVCGSERERERKSKAKGEWEREKV